MKCTRCGTELKNKEVCPKCGGKIPAPDVEVEYKDFKISEFLEIRRKQRKTKEGGNGSPVRDEMAAQSKPARPAKSLPAQEAGKKPEAGGKWYAAQAEKSRMVTIIIWLLAVLAGAAGAYYLLQLLFQ